MLNPRPKLTADLRPRAEDYVSTRVGDKKRTLSPEEADHAKQRALRALEKLESDPAAPLRPTERK